ncbi:PP2C family protein-serine/threonine phosphatase [Actinomadura macra]|uniref:PP2C family protein-serine/threonine phosphatase n=1 Tax=Actinomadura macra TaxID=46164 RepID=UPI000A0109E5|nr:protein phosphatase 2C domain-containing protein [Actinomadura macra]
MAHHVLRFAAGTDVGQRRKVNEDSAYAGPRLLAVADGMGGHPHGDVASRAAITAIAELAARLSPDLPAGDDLAADLAAVVAGITRRLDDLGRQDAELRRMGTTLTAMAWGGAGFTVAHVGDSRGYLLRDGALVQITRDHTMVQSLVDGGQLTMEEAARHPRSSVLVRALQSGSDAHPDIYRQDARPGDRFLLCSDGVFGYVPHEAIRSAVAGSAEPERVVARLIDLANGAGGPDNITCVVADVLPASAGAGERVPLTIGAAGRDAAGPLARLGRRLRRA